MQMRVGWGGRWSTGALATQVAEHAKLQAHRRHLEESTARRNEGQAEGFHANREWACGNPLKGAWWKGGGARREVQMMHGLLPTARQMARRECADSEEAALCTLCRVEETQWHVIGQCKHPKCKAARTEQMRHLDAVIQKAPTKHRMREVLEWIYFVQDGRWDSEGVEPELSGEGEMGAAVRNLGEQ